MSDSSNQLEQMFEVVVNQEGQYSIWPANKLVPDGWSKAGKHDRKEPCLEFIRDVWKDMRPLSLRA